MCQAINQQLVDEMELCLKRSFPDGEFQITDGDDGMHLHVTVSTGQFQNKSLLDQHKMVYAALNDLIVSGELHSVNIKTSLL